MAILIQSRSHFMDLKRFRCTWGKAVSKVDLDSETVTMDLTLGDELIWRADVTTPNGTITPDGPIAPERTTWATLYRAPGWSITPGWGTEAPDEEAEY